MAYSSPKSSLFETLKYSLFTGDLRGLFDGGGFVYHCFRIPAVLALNLATLGLVGLPMVPLLYPLWYPPFMLFSELSGLSLSRCYSAASKY